MKQADRSRGNTTTRSHPREFFQHAAVMHRWAIFLDSSLSNMSTTSFSDIAFKMIFNCPCRTKFQATRSAVLDTRYNRATPTTRRKTSHVLCWYYERRNRKPHHQTSLRKNHYIQDWLPNQCAYRCQCTSLIYVCNNRNIALMSKMQNSWYIDRCSKDGPISHHHEASLARRFDLASLVQPYQALMLRMLHPRRFLCRNFVWKVPLSSHPTWYDV